MTDKPCSIWIGFDHREVAAFVVAKQSARDHCIKPIPIYGLVLDELQKKNLYWRPTERRLGKLWDVISDHWMSTEFAISRFLVPHLAGTGWALFMDSDMLVRGNLDRLFESLDDGYAAYCVKHDHRPAHSVKMDGQAQSQYFRKNWSSFIAFNCDHPANQALTLNYVNREKGRDLHGLGWLREDQIGELGTEWNWLAGYSSPNIDPKVVHHTEGSPCLVGFENAPYADEWRAVLHGWAA